MKQIVMLLTLILNAPLTGMQPATTPLKSWRIVKLKPNEHLEIEKNLLIHIIRKRDPEPVPPSVSSQAISALNSLAELSEPTRRLSEFVLSKAPAAEKLCTVEILTLTEVTKRIEEPYFVVKDENALRLHLHNRSYLDELGISLKEIIITVPQKMNVITLRTAEASL